MPDLRSRLAVGPPDEIAAQVEAYLCGLVAVALGRPEHEIRSAAGERPLTELGLDSIVGIELKNRIERDLGVTLPIVVAVRGATLREMATELIGRLPAGAGAPEPEPDAGTPLDARLARLPEADVDRLLADLLEAPDATRAGGAS